MQIHPESATDTGYAHQHPEQAEVEKIAAPDTDQKRVFIFADEFQFLGFGIGESRNTDPLQWLLGVLQCCQNSF